MPEGEVPLWARRYLRVTMKVAKKARLGRSNDGAVPADLRGKVREYLDGIGGLVVFRPVVPEGLARREAAEIERAAERAVKKGYRPKPEYYPVPPEYRRDSLKEGYYLARLGYEIKLREGCKKRGGRAG